MAERKSILDDAGFESIGRKGGAAAAKGGGMKKNDQIKLGIAAGAIVIAGVLLAWNFGLLGGEGAPQTQRPAQFSPEEQKQAEEQERINRQLEQQPNVTTGGA